VSDSDLRVAFITSMNREARRGQARQLDCSPDNICNPGVNRMTKALARKRDDTTSSVARYRGDAVKVEIRFAIGTSSLGAVLVASSGKGIASILLGDDPRQLVRELQDRFPKVQLVGADKEYEQLVARVVGFIEAPSIGLDLALDIRGTAFQQRVWRALRDVPVGRTVSYADIAQRIGAPNAVRAVAGACAANDIALCIPCHRVVRNDGSLSGYAWGVDRKRALIEREAAAAGARA
jgi:AraC family transcriptional regulator of adaptative response/methylated-DNA-[protein]-cysteine methyltransferase